jgi:hypothetical protein
MNRSWLTLSFDMMRLGLEAQSVITLRTMKIMQGGAAAERETRQMVTEKMAAAIEAGAAVTAGMIEGQGRATLTRKAMKGYKRRVTANRKRLSR